MGTFLTVVITLIAVGIAKFVFDHYKGVLEKLPGSESLSLRYDPKGAIGRPEERLLFRVLRDAVGANATILMKVRLADIVVPARGQPKRASWRAFGKIKTRHVDFVVCDPKGLKPFVVIELNDQSRDQELLGERGEFLREVFNQCGIPLLFLPLQSKYSVSELRRLMARRVPMNTQPAFGEAAVSSGQHEMSGVHQISSEQRLKPQTKRDTRPISKTKAAEPKEMDADSPGKLLLEWAKFATSSD